MPWYEFLGLVCIIRLYEWSTEYVDGRQETMCPMGPDDVLVHSESR